MKALALVVALTGPAGAGLSPSSTPGLEMARGAWLLLVMTSERCPLAVSKQKALREPIQNKGYQ